jgi:PBP1b-binding outer membrane lipoprotein LpoB
MRTLISFLIFSLLLTSCGGTNAPKSSTKPDQPLQVNETSLPDRITCDQGSTSYQLVLVIKDQNLPEGVSVVGLKHNEDVQFKVTTQTYTSDDDSEILSFIEVPATENSKEVKLNLSDKTAVLMNSQIQELDENPIFSCNF